MAWLGCVVRPFLSSQSESAKRESVVMLRLFAFVDTGMVWYELGRSSRGGGRMLSRGAKTLFSASVSPRTRARPFARSPAANPSLCCLAIASHRRTWVRPIRCGACIAVHTPKCFVCIWRRDISRTTTIFFEPSLLESNRDILFSVNVMSLSFVVVSVVRCERWRCS